MNTTNYTQPVSVPVNINYADTGLLQSSPQMAHTSISPRPSSSETDSVYPSGGMLEMSNGYPNSASPMGGSPSPGPSPGPGLSSSKQHPKQHSPGPRSSLRVVIPAPLGQSISADEVSYGEVSISNLFFLFTVSINHFAKLNYRRPDCLIIREQYHHSERKTLVSDRIWV